MTRIPRVPTFVLTLLFAALGFFSIPGCVGECTLEDCGESLVKVIGYEDYVVLEPGTPLSRPDLLINDSNAVDIADYSQPPSGEGHVEPGFVGSTPTLVYYTDGFVGGTKFSYVPEGEDGQVGTTTWVYVTVKADDLAQCEDGVDNDGDGDTDMADAGCSSPQDNDESDDPTTTPPDGRADFFTLTEGEVEQAQDILGNDGNTANFTSLTQPGEGSVDRITLASGLPGVRYRRPTPSFRGVTTYTYRPVSPDGMVGTPVTVTVTAQGAEYAACNDTIDNDGDGFTDYPNDPGCSSLDDDDESDDPTDPETPPVGTDDTILLTPGTPLARADVLRNDDRAQDVHDFTQPPAGQGRVERTTVNGTPAVKYYRDGFTGSTSFTYRPSNQHGVGNTTTVRVTAQ